MIFRAMDWVDNFIFKALPGNETGEHTALMLFIGSYFTIVIGAAVTLMMIHLNDPSDNGQRIKDMFGIVDRKVCPNPPPPPRT